VPQRHAADERTFATPRERIFPRFLAQNRALSRRRLGAAKTRADGHHVHRSGREHVRQRHGQRDDPPCSTLSHDGPTFSVAGTVFARGHVPDGCKTDPAKVALSQAKVVITDANGTEHTLPVNPVGNFYYELAIPKPYQARVEYMGKTRAMSAAQTDGDCNGCHTADGTKDAPGRIALPQ
jgi:hypothetical protein